MPEEKIVAFCGLLCNECPAFIAKRTNDDEARKKAVDAWSSEDFPLKIGDINCDGCIGGKELFKHCTMCDVRKCGLEKGIKNCAYCAEYPCKKLEELWGFLQSSQARDMLNEIRKTL
ncbi:MAG: DUF3795 domain-containing protein [Thermoplasmatales archaeon]|nr:DUF3795 domain-containing protein [Methanomicrobia archaeon]MCK4348895.1 DUF3795 domain-containing protein [Thermoplasmatales archaeon]